MPEQRVAPPLTIDKGALLAAAEVHADCELPVEYRNRRATRLRFWLGGKLLLFAAWVMGTNIRLSATIPRSNVRFR